jgi:hypothetical protein
MASLYRLRSGDGEAAGGGMTDLTPKQQRAIEEAALKFKKAMEKTGMGVTIQVNDQPPVVVTKPPEKPK